MSNNLAAFNAETWSRRMVEKLDQINIMLPLVNRDWEGDLRHSSTVWVRTPGNISMGSYTRGAAISYQDLAPTKEAFTVGDGEYFAFEVDDIDRAQSDVNAMDVYTKRAVVAMNNTIESKILSAYTSAGVQLGAEPAGSGAAFVVNLSGGAVSGVTVVNGGTGYPDSGLVVQFVGGNGNGAAASATVSGGVINGVTVTAGGSNYTIAPSIKLTTASPVTLTSTAGAPTDIYPVFCQARAILSKANVPSTAGSRWAVIDPDTTSLLLEDTEHFVRAGELGDRVVQYGTLGGEEIKRSAAEAPGFIGMVAGFAVYETPHAPQSGGNKFLLFGDNEAISYASQIVEIEALRLQTTFATAIRGLLLHDVFVPAEGAKRLVTVKATA